MTSARPSIGKRLYVSLVISLCFLWLGVVALETWVIQHETEEVFDSSLQETAQRLLALATYELKVWPSPAKEHLAALPADHDEYLTYQIYAQDGRILMRSHVAPKVPYPVPLAAGFYTVGEQHFYVESSRDRNYWIKLAEHNEHRKSTRNSILQMMLLPLGILIPISMLAVYLSVRSVALYIRKLDSDLSTRDSKDLNPIDTAVLPSELLNLGETVNSLMARLKAALDAERNFTANSAHELRTPIASAMAQLDVLRDQTPEPGARSRVLNARQMLERLEQMTIKLLQLARAESGVAFTISRIDLAALAKMLVHDLSFRSDRDIRLALPACGVSVMGDLDAIGIVMQNLLENADRYATPDTPVEIILTEAGTLVIRNDCPAIPKQMLATLRERFVRGDQTKSGSGIGLSIVDTILGQCSAALSLESPCFENGRGFAASIRFHLSER